MKFAVHQRTPIVREKTKWDGLVAVLLALKPNEAIVLTDLPGPDAKLGALRDRVKQAMRGRDPYYRLRTRQLSPTSREIWLDVYLGRGRSNVMTGDLDEGLKHA